MRPEAQRGKKRGRAWPRPKNGIYRIVQEMCDCTDKDLQGIGSGANMVQDIKDAVRWVRDETFVVLARASMVPESEIQRIKEEAETTDRQLREMDETVAWVRRIKKDIERKRERQNNARHK